MCLFRRLSFAVILSGCLAVCAEYAFYEQSLQCAVCGTVVRKEVPQQCLQAGILATDYRIGPFDFLKQQLILGNLIPFMAQIRDTDTSDSPY